MWTEGMFPSFGLLCFDDIKWTYFKLLDVAMCVIYDRSKQNARMCFISVPFKFCVLESPFLRWSIYSCSSFQKNHLASWATSLPGSRHVVWNEIKSVYWVTDISTGHHKIRDSDHYFVCFCCFMGDITFPAIWSVVISLSFFKFVFYFIFLYILVQLFSF